MNLSVMLAGFIVGMIGVLVGAVATFLYLQHSVKALGFNVSGAAYCVECSNRCEWFNGACVTHWSSGGYMFCSEACVVHHRQRMASALAGDFTDLLPDPIDELGSGANRPTIPPGSG